MRSLRFLFALLICSLAPVYAQFAVTVQQNGQATNIASGGSFTLNTPAIGQTASAIVTLTYVGAGTAVFQTPLSVVGPPEFKGGGPGATLQPFQSVTIGVSYTSIAPAAETAQLFFPYEQLNSLGAVVGTASVSLTAIGTAPNPVVAQVNSSGSLITLTSGTAVQFPDTLIGGASNTSFAIANTGSAPAIINSISTTGSEFQFQNLPLFPITINAGSQISFALRFAPVAAGSRTGSMQISFASGSFTATLSGNGIGSLLTYQLIENGVTSAVSPGSNIAVPDTATGVQSTAALVIQNTGSAAVTISSVGISGTGFSFFNPPFFPLTLPPQQSTTLTIAYNPTVPGPSVGRLAIGGDTFTLSANGLGSALVYDYQIGGSSSPISAGGSITLPQIAVGQSESMQFTVTNSGTIAGSLFNVSLTSANGAFRLANLPALPLQLNANVTSTFTITFTPPAAGPSTATLQVNSQTFTLNGNGLGPALQFSYQSGSTTAPINAGGTIPFPATSFGQTSSVQFLINNTGTGNGSVGTIGITGGGGAFQLGTLPQLPLQIGVTSAASFPILFTPQATGQTTAVLQVDNQQFTLSGTASNPPALPTYHFTGATSGIGPFQQPAIGLSLDATYPVAIGGTLTLSVSSSNLATDPAVQFSSGGRTVAFTIPANTLQAVFPSGSTQIQIQSGTVVSGIQLTPSFNAGLVNGVSITPSNPTTLQLNVPAAAPVILGAALGARTLTTFSITLSAFSTTRYVDHVNVQFTPSAGSKLSATSFTIDLSGASRIFFQSTASQTTGGQFLVDVPFTLVDTSVSVGTDLTKSISSVSLTAVNDVGSSNTVQVALP